MLAEAAETAPGNWPILPIEEVCSWVTSGGTPSRKIPEFFKNGTWAWVKTQELRDKWIEDTEEHITDEAIQNSAAKILPSNTVLIAMYGATVGQLGLIRHPMACNQACCAFIVDEKKADFKYLFYQLLLHRRQLKSSAVGAAQQNLNARDLRQFRLPFPSLPEQRTIAFVLGALDDKIELNQSINRSLEAIAQAVFRHWFVDSNDVNKWEVIELGQFADVIDCMHSKKPDRQIEGKPLIQLWNILDDGLLDMTDTYFITEKQYKHWISRIEATTGDCLITNTGRVAAIAQIPEGFKAALGRNMTGIRCKGQYPFPTFLLEYLRSNYMRQEIDRKTDIGTILNSLNVRNIPTLRFRLPPADLIQTYEKIARPLRSQMEKNLIQTRTLANLRDTLLPKLMRGEIRVKV